MQNPSIADQRAEINGPNKRYETSIRRLHSILRKFYKYVLKKRLYLWRGKDMTYANCPNKLRLLLADQIKSKKVLDSLLKKGTPIKPFNYECKTYLSEEINKICTYLSSNPQRAIEQTEKLVQIIYDFREPLIHICRLQCYGSQDLDQILVDYLNEECSYFFDTTTKFTVKCNAQYDMEMLLEPYNLDIIFKEIERNLDYQDTITEQEIKKIEEDEKDLFFQSENYNKEKFQVYNKENLTELQRNNFMIKYRNHLEEYLWHFEVVKTFERKDTRYRFEPRSVTTESLKKQRQVGHSRMSYRSEQNLMRSPERRRQNEEQSKEKIKKVEKQRSQHKNQGGYRVKQASKHLKQLMQKRDKNKNKNILEHKRKVQNLIDQYPQIQSGLNILVSNRLQINQNKLLDLVTPNKMKKIDKQQKQQRKYVKVKKIYELESLEGNFMSQSQIQQFKKENSDFSSAQINQNKPNQLWFDEDSRNIFILKNEKTQQQSKFGFDEDQFEL